MLCGASRETINPELGHLLAGYGPDYPNEGVHDDISVTCLFFDDGDQKALLLCYDLIMFTKDYIELLRSRIGEATGIDADNIFSTVTHVHSGPVVCMRGKPGDDEVSQMAATYREMLLEKSITVAKAAVENAEECELYYNYAYVPENMNRRYFLPNRQHLFIPLNKQLAGGSTEPADEELGILAFRKKGTRNKYKAIISNYTAHPLCVGNASNLVTADYQGVIRKTVEETFTGALVCSTLGAAGELHPRKPESGFAEAERMGQRLGTVVVERMYDSVLIEDEHLRLARPEFEMRLKDSTDTVTTCVSLLGIGPLLFAGVPGELSSILGSHVKTSCGFLKSYILQLSTDCLSYLSARNQFYWGGYEPGSSRVAPGEAEKIAYTIITEAEKLLEQKPMKLNEMANWDGRH